MRPSVPTIAILLAWLALPVLGAGEAGIIRLPLGEEARWQALRYRGLPAHELRFSPAGLEMRVAGSAMPVIHAFPKAVLAAQVRVKARIAGALAIPAGRQGEEKFDDYVLRVGLVEAGPRTLNFVQRQLAAPWVRTLFDLAPHGRGISRIHFLNVGSEASHVGRRRQHPLSELLHEEVVAALPADGRIELSHTLARPVETLAVWLSADGDDTGARYTVLIEEIELRLAPL